MDALTAVSARRSAGATAPGSAARKSASCAAGASHSSPLKRLASGTQAADVAVEHQPLAGSLELVADHAGAVAVAVPLGLEELVEQQRRHHRRREQLLVRVLQRGAGAGAQVADQRHGRGAAVELRRDAPLPHAEDLGERVVLEVLELRLVRGRVHDHLVPALQRGVLVGDHAHASSRGRPATPPPGRRASTSGGVSASLPAQKGQGGAAGVAPGGVRRPGGPRGRDDRQLAADRVAAQLAAAGRHRPPPSPATANSSRPLCLAAYMAASARASAARSSASSAATSDAARRDRQPQAAVLGRGEARVVDDAHEAPPVHGEVVLAWPGRR